MLDEYLALGGVELGNNARVLAYSRCLPCCAGLLKGGVCEGIHDATGPWTDAVKEWQEVARNLIPDPRGITPATTWGNTGGTPTSDTDPGVSWLVTAATVALGPEVALPVSADHTVTMTLESDIAVTGTLYYRPTIGSATGQVLLADPVVLLPGEPLLVSTTFTTTATAASATAGVYFVSTGATVGATIRVVDAIVSPGLVAFPYFDGSATSENPDMRFSWEGATDASVSIREDNVVIVPAQSLNPAYTCANISSAPWFDPDKPESAEFAGYYLLSVKGITDDTLTAPVTQGVDDGGVIGAGRYVTKSVRVKTMLVGCGSLATEYGLAWLKAALSTSFCGRHGDGCGTSDLEFFMDCPPALDPADTDYAATTARYRRYLHGVGTTSGAVIAEEYLTPSGAYVMIVEYILTAESPFVWGQTIPIQNTGAVLTAYDDIPFNLMRYPSGEVGDGVPAVVATQYAFNGSVEFGTTGWSHAETSIPAGITAGQTTDIAAVGPNSYRVRLLATGTVTNGVIDTFYDVALGAIPGGSKPSVSLWGAGLIFAGAPTVGELRGLVEWRTAVATISTVDLGTVPLNGGNFSATGLTIPATATIARLHVRASDVDAIAADDLRIYADAFALTVP